MATFRFELASSHVGTTDFDALEGIAREQLLETARTAFGMDACHVPSDFCREQAAEMGDDADTIEVAFWRVFDGDTTSPTFELLYFWWCDGGVLFHAGTTRAAGARLWPHGFVTEPGADPGLDVDALSGAFRAAVAAQVAGS